MNEKKPASYEASLPVFRLKLLHCIKYIYGQVVMVQFSPYMVFNGFSESTLLYILLIAAKKCPVIEAIRTRQTHV